MKTSSSIITFLILAFLFTENIYSANPNLQFSQISTKQGLSQNTVRAILADDKGFIWAGTLDGINRYDGYQIKRYKPQPGDLNSIPDHRIKDLFQDKDGYLWIKSYDNVFTCYDLVHEKIININNLVSKDRQSYYLNYYEARNGDIWLWGNTNGCLRIRKSNGVFDVRPFTGEKGSDWKCKFLTEAADSSIWIGTGSGVFCVYNETVETLQIGDVGCNASVELGDKIYFVTDKSTVIEYNKQKKSFQSYKDPITRKFRNIAVLNENELLVSVQGRGLLIFNIRDKSYSEPSWAVGMQTSTPGFIVDKNNGLWVYNHTGKIVYINPQKNQIRHLTLIPSETAKIIDLERYNIFTDSNGLIWITTYGNGLFTYDPQENKLINYKYNPTQNSPASNYLLSITEDKAGNIWIGSEYAGIIKVVKSDLDFEIFYPENRTYLGRDNNIRNIYLDKNKQFWVSSKNGTLYVYDYSLDKLKWKLENINPYYVTEDDEGRIWVGTKGHGLYIINNVNFKILRHITTEDKSNILIHNTVFSILKGDEGDMWIGTFGGGLSHIEEGEGMLKARHFFENKGNRSYIRCLYLDSKGIMWVGSSDGLIRFNPDTFKKNPSDYEIFRLDQHNETSLSCNDVKTIFEDSNGTIWIGTAGGGLNKYIGTENGTKEAFAVFSSINGLSGDVISGILEDREGCLWVSTENGISKFDKKNNSFISYTFSEQTYGNSFNENANVYTPDGYMLWGSLDGIVIFYPQEITFKENNAPVTLTGISVFGQPIEVRDSDSPLKQSISYSDNITLSYNQNTFTLEFSMLSLKNPLQNRYTYKLVGYDKEWSPASNYNMAMYRNLPPGNYVFMVKGSNSNGVWSDDVTEFNIAIKPPFWKSNYAYFIYAIIVIVLLYLAVRLVHKFNKLNNDIKLEKQLTYFKLRFFTNISHEFRTPLTLIRGSVENLNEDKNLPPSVKKYLNTLNKNSIQLNRLIDQLLEFRKIQNNVLTLNLEKVNIIEFVKDIYESFAEIARQKHIIYTFNGNYETYMMYIDKSKMDKVVYNLISNAFKFIPENETVNVIVTIDVSRKVCLISVKDTGIGIPRDKQDLLFSRFMQINFSQSGTGVGLSIVKEFVDVHKGKVWYEENGEKGSVFNVELSTDQYIYTSDNFIIPPTSQQVEYPKENHMSVTEVIDNENNEVENDFLSDYKILIIDDNNDILTFLSDEFRKRLMNVDIAVNGKEGLEKAIEINPDLIICDVMMPEMNGFEITKRLKSEFQTCHIPIILLTAHSSMEHQVEGIESGADAYIIKPFSIKYLVARVFKLINQREQLKKRFSSEYIVDGNLITTTDKDKVFYDQINSILDKNIDNPEFTVDKFAEMTGQRRTIFYKKIKGITGLSPNELIKTRRLQKAATLLVEGKLIVSEIAYKVGFDDPYYFSKCFKAQYGCSPSKFTQSEQNKNKES